MEIEMKMKIRSHIYDIYRPGPRHGLKDTKCKKYISMIMFIYVKQNLKLSSWIG